MSSSSRGGGGCSIAVPATPQHAGPARCQLTVSPCFFPAVWHRYRESPFDTPVFVLQTDAATHQWPATPEVEAAVRRAFAEGVPTPAMVARRLKEGRGLADADGGGGVYRGKRSRATGQGVVARKHQERKRQRKARRQDNGDAGGGSAGGAAPGAKATAGKHKRHRSGERKGRGKS